MEFSNGNTENWQGEPEDRPGIASELTLNDLVSLDALRGEDPNRLDAVLGGSASDEQGGEFINPEDPAHGFVAFTADTLSGLVGARESQSPDADQLVYQNATAFAISSMRHYGFGPESLPIDDYVANGDAIHSPRQVREDVDNYLEVSPHVDSLISRYMSKIDPEQHQLEDARYLAGMAFLLLDNDMKYESSQARQEELRIKAEAESMTLQVNQVFADAMQEELKPGGEFDLGVNEFKHFEELVEGISFDGVEPKREQEKVKIGFMAMIGEIAVGAARQAERRYWNGMKIGIRAVKMVSHFPHKR